MHNHLFFVTTLKILDKGKKPPTTIRRVLPLFKALDCEFSLYAGCLCALAPAEDLCSAKLSSMGVLSLPLLPVSFCQINHLFSLLRYCDQI